MKAFILIITSLSLLLMYSCDEDPIESSINNGRNITTSTTFTNPYDSVGIVHNLIMQEVITLQGNLYEVCDSSSFSEELIDVISESICNVGWNTPSSNCEAYYDTNIVNMNNFQDNYTDLDDLMDDFISTSAKNKANELLDIILDDLTLNEIKDDIEIWEEEVNNTTTFTTTENQILLATSSVARHSLTYWHSVSNNPNHAWRYDMSCSGSSMKIGNRYLVSEEWQTIGYADATGALKGGLYAAFTGGGILAGAAAGAGAYSITAAITVYWDDISEGASKVLDWLCLWCD